MKKVVVVSLPKSGTYLMGNVLQNLGFRNTYKHLSKSGGQEYDPNNLEDGIKNPRKYDSKKTLKQSLNELQAGDYALSHLGYDNETADLLKDFFVIYLYRDEKEIEQSFKRWCEKSGRPYVPWRKDKLDKISLWKEKADFSLEFNDIINHNVEKIDQLQIQLLGNLQLDSKNIIELSIQMDSMTKVR